MTKLLSLSAAGAIALGLAGAVQAHTPLCACYDNGDGTALCEGGFSDGSSASGAMISVIDGAGAVLVEGKIDNNGEFTFGIPDGPYTVLFDAGEGHRIEIPSGEIF
ncbi:hypothetical protein C8N32_110110 [Rhodovulum imhoffii]|uniref:Carboxypeptidase family protein n=1 Tax=Rhodovulum imhoffii TaxID=365340 RepID=A0A2T5BRF0_9RHOB|nr:carboxypeptidase-like regulatory domain-containing protein [Rhodovulum imhoffii]MBK5934478.1 hypothetical protein [Rhodovulum imhoffii]PTN01828.1 hypothetical protein C8N32_110110 [Rhodovulum imhoffii]